MKKYGFGVDIGGTTIKMGLFETNGNLLDKWEIDTDTSDGGKNILSDVAKAIDDKLSQENIGKEEVQGIGVGVPGPVTHEGIVNRSVNLGWGVVDVVTELSSLTGLKVSAGNDANVAAMGEMWQGAAIGCRDVVMVTLGTGVGGGIIVDGRILAGYSGAGGEIGHMTVKYDEKEVCNCGQYGCLEQYTSATGVVRLAKRKLQKTTAETVLRNYEKLTATIIFNEAKAGDAIALEIVDELGRIMGSALSNIAVFANPEIIVIGGGVSNAGEILVNTIQKHYEECALYAVRDTKFTIAKLRNDAGIYGGMALVME